MAFARDRDYHPPHAYLAWISWNEDDPCRSSTSGGQSGGQSGGRKHKTKRDGEADGDPQDPGAPGRDIDRTERLLDVTAVVVPVVVAVIVGRVVGDRTRMAGGVQLTVIGGHRPHSGRPSRRTSDA